MLRKGSGMTRTWKIVAVAFVLVVIGVGVGSRHFWSEGGSSDPVALLRDMFHSADVKNFAIKGPDTVAPGTYSSVDWPIQAGFVVDYDVPPKDGGHKTWFMYLGRKTPDSPWQVISGGTGP
jgi:hypothetical protein